ncbi:MAG TPA: bifunctional riboflavin kinase/FAD synthetase [Tetrasphaera sp.]|uniref:bifunctional riboflavin kinase/FAD synthetase n=1 Tax=Nostocoides sp. TaxID=1917966 RepID=UPI002C6CD898|nr:bifunctional riboflavin kinase/FAD synthetase [Tetrasphaera sp.]HNQ07918.1 bifunctional riboflavin kinase/FAD synthetase [Tetrasphaera sp.]
MHRWTDPADTPADLKGCVATFGNFDGVHRGHQVVIATLRAEAARRGVPAVALTFDPHPVQVLHPERAPELISPAGLHERLLEETGIDGLLVVPFTRAYAQQSAEDFIISTFVDGLGVSALVVGADTKGFGVGYTGDVDLIRELGDRHGFEVIVVQDQGDDRRWSSSAVREHLRLGEVAEAAAILGRPHRVIGIVVHGYHRGRELGYPTANLERRARGVVPADGVYAGWLTRLDMDPADRDYRLPAAISVGTNPTFEGTERTVEAYCLDRTDLDLYGEEVAVDFVAHIRPTLKFDSIDALLEAMAQDVVACRSILAP